MARGQSVRQMGSTRHFFVSSKTKAKQNLRACQQGCRWQRVGMDAPSGQREAAHGRWANLTAIGSVEAESRKETHDTAPPVHLSVSRHNMSLEIKAQKVLLRAKNWELKLGVGGWVWVGPRGRGTQAGKHGGRRAVF